VLRVVVWRKYVKAADVVLEFVWYKMVCVFTQSKNSALTAHSVILRHARWDICDRNKLKMV
jgi:hypothetical protein